MWVCEGEDQYPKLFWARNCMKYPDLQRKKSCVEPLSPCGGVGINFQKYVFCQELNEMSRSTQKNMSPICTHGVWMGDGLQVPIYFFYQLYEITRSVLKIIYGTPIPWYMVQCEESVLKKKMGIEYHGITANYIVIIIRRMRIKGRCKFLIRLYPYW